MNVLEIVFIEQRLGKPINFISIAVFCMLFKMNLDKIIVINHILPAEVTNPRRSLEKLKLPSKVFSTI